jgi:hypothetical protein
VPSLTDGVIRRTLKQVEQTGKQVSLVDGDGHGTGRLVLVMKPMPTRVTADWMVQQWRDQKRLKKKIGSYPSTSLGTAREIFKRDFADMIQLGRSIKIAGDTRPGTVADLFEAYVEHLKSNNKSSWKEAEKGLNKSRILWGAIDQRVKSKQKRSLKSFGRFTSVVGSQWLTMCVVTSTQPSVGE